MAIDGELPPEEAPEEEEEILNISFEEAYNIALELAKKQFGENAFIVPASEKTALEVKINGNKAFSATFSFFSGK